MSQKKTFCALILAAGKGTRMHSRMPKVLHTLLNEPLIYYPINSVKNAAIRDVSVVVGFAGEQVELKVCAIDDRVGIVWQREQLGTGHAAKLAEEWWNKYDNVLVLPGDAPLITSDTLSQFIARHLSSDSQCSLLSFEPADPSGYGRVIRKDNSIKIVEHKDATPDERRSREVNSGIYIFDSAALASVIDKIKCDNAQKEYYLPDALSLIEAEGGTIDAFKAADAEEFLGINDPIQLAQATRAMRDRILSKWMVGSGLKCVDPVSTWIGPNVELGGDITIEPNVQIYGRSNIGSGSHIGSFTVLNDARIGENVNIIGSVRINNSTIGESCSVGPYVFIRDNAEIMDNVRVGRFVEIKKSHIADGTKIPHLSYIGDAEIGTNTNIGAGTITCNYDGVNKNKTKIGNDCFIGSDTMLIAPLNIGNKAMTAAGSTITNDVPDEALGMGRARQTVIKGWYSRWRKSKGGK